jgi:two-component system, NarL family, invasion response regulator UvrY
MIKIFLAEEHRVLREGIKEILSDEKDILVTSESFNTEKMIQSTEKTEPDVLITDMSEPVKKVLDNLAEFKKKFPHTKILILGMYDDKEVVAYALNAGADGYLNKDSVSEELVNAVRDVYLGKIFIGSSIDKNPK